MVVVDKETGVASHQTGHNSGVIHSGLYYQPKSLKATMAKAGAASMMRFSEEHGVAYNQCGKLVVATRTNELPQLEALHRRGLDNGLEIQKVDVARCKDIEPHVAAIAGLWIPSTGIADYGGVCRVLSQSIQAAGSEILLGTTVLSITRVASTTRVTTTHGDIEACFLINCAGLQSDRVARLGGADPTAQIIPFRGEYFELAKGREHLVKGLVYPVPNPDFPFLGVHFTRMIDGSVHAGPNAVLAWKREGYKKTDLDLGDLAEILRYRGFHRLAAKNWREGAREMWRSLSRTAFLKSLQELIPEISDPDIVPTHAGVRAQAVKPDGRMVDDFLLVEHDGALHVCNAPSPAATASLEIGNAIVARIPSDITA